nr:vitelline membrane outer layer protein 1-like [Procambarus clarkii]
MRTFSVLLQLMGSGFLLGGYSQEITSEYRNVTQVLRLDNGLSWGLWGAMDFCEKGSFAHAFEIKFDPPGGVDNTAVNGVKLYCRNKDLYDTGYVTSVVGPNGDWLGMRVCHEGFLTGLRADVMEPQGVLHDDVAVYNVDMMCEDGEYLIGWNTSYVFEEEEEVSSWDSCDKGTHICGLQTRYEDFSVGDDTGTNDIVMFCCRD